MLVDQGSMAHLVATSGRTATTKAMGKGSYSVHSTSCRTEVPPKLLEDWLETLG